MAVRQQTRDNPTNPSEISLAHFLQSDAPMSRLLSRGSLLTASLVVLVLAGPLLADAAAQVSVPGNYPTIQAAIDAVPSGTTINVQPGTYAEALVVSISNKSITVRGVGGPGATIVDAAGRNTTALHVVNSTGTIAFQGLTFRNGAQQGTLPGGAFLIQNASPSFANMVFEASSAFDGGGGALFSSNATFTGVIIRNNSARRFGGGLYIVSGSRPVFTACDIVSNASGTGGAGVATNGAGGGVFSHDSATTIRGGRISGNSSRFAAGGVYHFGSFGAAVAPLVIEDAEIADNVSSQFSSADNPSEGGGLHVEDNAVATLTRVRVLRNRANTGGGLSAFRARIDLIDTIVDSNVAAPTSSAPTTTGFGGGIVVTSNNPSAPAQPGGVLSLTRTLVRNNTATQAAGGIGVFGDNFTSVRAVLWMGESVVSGNVSQGQGGGIHVSRADATIGNSLIISNTVSGGSLAFGGGLLLGTTAAANITATTIASNVAGLNGGGVFMDDGAALQMSGSRIFGNIANNPNQFGGGGLFVGPNGSSSGTIDSSIIADNTQYQIFENPCPKTRLTYTNNTITPRPGANDLYVSACAPFGTVTSISAFNSLANTSGNNSNLPRFAHFLATPRFGTSFTLAWSAARATSVTISGVGTSGAATGTADVAPSVAVTYSLTAAASAANGGNYGAVTAPVTPVAPPKVAKFVPGDFNGDSVADLALFRPSTGAWYVSGLGQLTWGGGNDIPLSGDFDGDRRADLAVFRPSTGAWYIRSTASGATFQYTWGGGNDIPVPADYDGDGRTDIAVFRQSTSTWYIYHVGSNTSVSHFWGGPGDVPVQGDYDGDGAADVAIFRPSTGAWYIIQSATGSTRQLVWGGSIDTAVPGDYDGDGRTDIGVFRASTSTWYLTLSATGTTRQVVWGGGGDMAVPGDYDGDGRTDVAIFRPSNGRWYIVHLGTGATASYVWGGAGDLPILRR